LIRHERMHRVRAGNVAARDRRTERQRRCESEQNSEPEPPAREAVASHSPLLRGCLCPRVGVRRRPPIGFRHSPSVQREQVTPARLLRRLDEIGESLARRADAVALIGLGSVGTDLQRLDEHSDLDFFVIVDEGAKPRYLASIDWLEDAAPVVYSFENSVDGRKALFAGWVFVAYAVFTFTEL